MSADIESLRAVPGIGDKMAKRFIEHFGSESLALEAILRADIAGISQVEGIGHRFAISLVHDIRSKIEGVGISDFLRTEEAMSVYEKLLELIKDYAHTNYARDKLHIHIPYPSKRSETIMRMRNSVSGYMETAKLLGEDTEIVSMLTRVKLLNIKLSIPKIRDRVIVCAEQETFEYVRERFGSMMDVQLAGSLSEFVDMARGYSHVVAADDVYMSFDLPEDINPEFISDIRKSQDWQIIPEKEMIVFSRNLSSLQCAIDVVRILRSRNVSFLDDVSDDELEVLASTLSLIDDEGNVIEGTDEEIDRLRHVIANLDACVAAALKDANLKFDESLAKSEFTLGGQDMLRVMKGSMEVKDVMGKQLHESYYSVMKECAASICDELNLQKKEMLFIDTLFPDEICHPVELDREQLSAFRQHMERRVLTRQLEHKRELGRVLSSYLDIARNMVREVLDFDVGFAIACFALDNGLEMPEIIEGPGLALEQGRNLFIASRHGDVVPIDYSVGRNSYSPDGDDSRVILLSGVNSGGKTSMLELIAQSVILAHMGFPVPATSSEISLTDGFYYFAKSKGTLDAGAFETTLTEFAVVADDSAKMVLADELESITEPGASAKIIAGILEVLTENKQSMSVFVSHLSELILENTTCKIRVDGIEASGLDADLNLVVERSPRYNYVAKSTPELIVERLSKKTSGGEQAFYEKLKKKFN